LPAAGSAGYPIANECNRSYPDRSGGTFTHPTEFDTFRHFSTLLDTTVESPIPAATFASCSHLTWGVSSRWERGCSRLALFRKNVFRAPSTTLSVVPTMMRSDDSGECPSPAAGRVSNGQGKHLDLARMFHLRSQRGAMRGPQPMVGEISGLSVRPFGGWKVTSEAVGALRGGLTAAVRRADPPQLRSDQFHFLQAHAIAAARRVRFVAGFEIPVGEIGCVQQPGRPPIRADELAGEIDEIGLLAEMPHEGHQAPWAGDRVGFEDVGVEAADGRAAVGDAHQVFFEGSVVSNCYTTSSVVPFEQWTDLREIAHPHRPAGFRRAAVVFPTGPVVHGLERRLDAREIDLVAGDPAQVGGPGLGVVSHRALAHDVGETVGRMFHVAAEVGEMRRAELHRSAHVVGLREQRIRWCMRRFGPRLAKIG